jgi:site-specific recombinase
MEQSAILHWYLHWNAAAILCCALTSAIWATADVSGSVFTAAIVASVPQVLELGLVIVVMLILMAANLMFTSETNENVSRPNLAFSYMFNGMTMGAAPFAFLSFLNGCSFQPFIE